jgi:hypothetical protein
MQFTPMMAMVIPLDAVHSCNSTRGQPFRSEAIQHFLVRAARRLKSLARLVSKQDMATPVVNGIWGHHSNGSKLYALSGFRASWGRSPIRTILHASLNRWHKSTGRNHDFARSVSDKGYWWFKLLYAVARRRRMVSEGSLNLSDEADASSVQRGLPHRSQIALSPTCRQLLKTPSLTQQRACTGTAHRHVQVQSGRLPLSGERCGGSRALTEGPLIR